MTSIIQSNRERKSRIDEGLVERLNSVNHVQSAIDTPIQSSMADDITPITDRKVYDGIIELGEKLNTWSLCSKPEFDKGYMTGSSSFIAILTDMYLKATQSQYRLARIIDIEKSDFILDDNRVDVGIVLRFPILETIGGKYRSKTPLHWQYEKSTSGDIYPVWIDLRGLTIDERMNIQMTEESVPSLNRLLEKLDTYKRIDARGLPSILIIDQQLKNERYILKSNISSARGVIYKDTLEISLASDSYNSDGIILISKGGKNG